MDSSTGDSREANEQLLSVGSEGDNTRLPGQAVGDVPRAGARKSDALGTGALPGTRAYYSEQQSLLFEGASGNFNASEDGNSNGGGIALDNRSEEDMSDEG